MTTTRLLAIETATVACSAALSIDGQIEERHALAPRQHAALILPMIESLLVEAEIKVTDLDAIAFGQGPGSFTGVRIAASVVQGIAFAASLPVVPVSSLAALAQGAMRETNLPQVMCALDARKAEVYWGVYAADANGLAALQGEECVCRPDNVPLPDGDGWAGAGSGWEAHGEALLGQAGSRVVRMLPDIEPRAADVARLGAACFSRGRVVSPEAAVPVYLRNKVADTR